MELENVGDNIFNSSGQKAFIMRWHLNRRLASLVAATVQEIQVQYLVGKTPWWRAWQPTPVFLPEESHGQRSWQATVHGVTKNQTQGEPPTLSLFTSTTRLREDLPQEVI